MLDSIFSPVFSFFSASSARPKAASAARPKENASTRAGSKRGVSARTHRVRGARKAAVVEEDDEDQSSEGDRVSVDGDGTRSIESNEAEETESDQALLSAASGEMLPLRDSQGMTPSAVSKEVEYAYDDDEYEYEEEVDDEEYDELFDPWAFIHDLPPLASCVPAKRQAILPRKTRNDHKNTLVLDLDETLVHSNLEQQLDESDFSFPVNFNNQQHIVNVRRRPYLKEFMEFAARHFEVVVFTASQRVYAERLLNKIDPDRILIKHRLYRESCVLVEGNYMKDLSVLGRDLARTIIVDNSPQAFGFQVDNGIPIESWFDDMSDRQLLKLMPLLARLASANDVRPLLRKKFQLGNRIERAGDRVAMLHAQMQQQGRV